MIMRLSYTILYVEDINRSVSFYQEAFGIELKFIHDSGEYAEMNTGATTLAFCAHNLVEIIHPKPYQKSSLKNIPLGSQITFEPEDVKKAYEIALNAGAQSIHAPEVKPWNFEVAMLRDCDGHIVELAKDLS